MTSSAKPAFALIDTDLGQVAVAWYLWRRTDLTTPPTSLA